jgi:hypothetical protein
MCRERANVPNGLYFLLLLLILLTADVQMPRLGFAPLDLHELVELQHPPLAARPPLWPLVEDGRAGVMHAGLVVSALRTAVRMRAALAPARLALGDREAGVVVFGFWCRGGSRLLWGYGGGGGRQRGGEARHGDLGLLIVWRRRFGGFGGGRVVDVGVCACGAGRDGEEFVEGEDAGFAAFPAWDKIC